MASLTLNGVLRCIRWSAFLHLNFMVSTSRFSVVDTSNETGRIFSVDDNWKPPFLPTKACYESVGCFSNEPPFYSRWRPVMNLPLPPAYLGTKFLLHTRDTFNGTSLGRGETLITGKLQSLNESFFNGDRQTKLIVHGFIQNGDADWVQKMAIELLKYDDFNVISVDWRKGAAWPYMQAVTNARLVGVQIANLVRFLVRRSPTQMDHFHVIGHSLGAHVAGYAGKRLKTLKRISGLDPANVFFRNVGRDVRLDTTDAQFVDVVHTDCGPIGFGLVDAVGHVDFYPNRGLKQPGCVDNEQIIHNKLFQESPTLSLEESSLDMLGCSHHRAVVYYTESINSDCQFFGFECRTWWRFQLGECWPCLVNKTCSRMGFHAAPLATAVRRMFLLSTIFAEQGPFCVNYYRMQLKVSNKQWRFARGHVLVLLHGQNETLPQQEMTHLRPFQVGPQTLFAQQTLGYLFHSLNRLEVSTVIVKYVRDVSFLEEWKYDSGLRVASVTVETMDNDANLESFLMCANQVIQSGHSRIMSTSNCTT